MEESQHDFAALAAILDAHLPGLSPAHVHGSLCGWLSVRGALEDWQWLDLSVDEPLSEALAPSELRWISGMVLATQQSFDAGEFAFQPLLPDPDSALLERAVALGEWCDGFVGGLGLAGMREQELSKTGREAVADLARIASTTMDVADGEEDDQAFEEVLEFVRIGAVLIFEELTSARQRAGRGTHGIHSTH